MQRGFACLAALLIALALNPVLVASQVATPAATPAATPVADVIELPAPTGPYAVGRTSFDWVDAARVEPFSEDPADQRELVVWVWYPAETTPEAEPAPYLPGQWGELLSAHLGFDPNRILTHAVAEAPLAATEATYPVLILSPGSGFFIGGYTALAEELASHGYIVVGLNHTYNAALTVFADGRAVPSSLAAQPLLPTADGGVLDGNAITAVHAADLRFVLDRLEQLDHETGLFQDRFDLSRIGIIGHSLGGAAAAEVCRVDRRCDAGVNMDGAFWGEAAAIGVSVPFLLLASEHTACAEQIETVPVTLEQCEEMQAIFAAGWEIVRHTAAPGYWLVIEGSRHGSFSDVPLLPVAPEIAGPLLAGTTIEPEPVWRVTSDYLLAFFDESLNGNPAPLLDGPSPEQPAVRFVEN